MTPDSLTFDIATAPKRNSFHWEQGTITWAELTSWLDKPAKTKACGNYLVGLLVETTVTHPKAKETCTGLHRIKQAVKLRGMLTLDVDYPDEGFAVDAPLLLPYAMAIHSTYSSIPLEPRYRLLIPLDRPVTPDEYAVAAASVMQTLGQEQFDAGSSQPERYMFKPAAGDPDAYEHYVISGPVAPVAELLKDFNADLSTLPTPKPHKNKRDPFTIDGPVGAFNRAYENLEDVIAEYELPYEQAETDRWHLVGASAAAGMSTVQPGLVYSHHSNDPAYGQTCSAFDLVRLHLHGYLDEDKAAGTPVNRLPSHAAMLETATTDLRVVRELVGDDFSAEMGQLAEDVIDEDREANWRMQFTLNSRSGFPEDDIRNWDLISKNDAAFKQLRFNEMTMAVEIGGDLPWRKWAVGKETFHSGDRSALALYIERVYRIRPPRAYLDDLISERSRAASFNPVVDYLHTLKWDGVQRVETCLPGVRPTKFTRLVGRKVMAAAVARMLDPGCKWDHMLVLFGEEGLGKSHWVEKMSKGFSASLGRIGDKDTLITMQRSWIMTSDEGHSLRKADFDAQKEFITRNSDVFRLPYEREASAHPRHCVIWGTTNDDVFLRRQEGNRRFLIVKCEEKVDFDALTDHYVDQVWAEALHLYRAGEQLWLGGDDAALAAKEREAFTEEDALTGVIQAYLGTLIPEDWYSMSPEGRQLWLQNQSDGFTAAGTERMDTVCSMQIWVEALGRRRGDHKRVDLLEINTALKQLQGWHPRPDNKWVPGYGMQKVFERYDPNDLI